MGDWTMETDTTMKFSGDWATITDVPCPCSGCDGVLRWDEAGYVPGHRRCDGTTQHVFRLEGGVLVHYDSHANPHGPPDRQAERRQLVAEDRRAAAAAAVDAVGIDGINVSAYWINQGCGYGTPEAPQAYRGRLHEVEPELIAEWERLTSLLPPSVASLSVFRDGQVMLYRNGVRSQELHGGTWLVDAAAIVAGRQNELAATYFERIGAERGYRVAQKDGQ